MNQNSKDVYSTINLPKIKGGACVKQILRL